MRIALLYPTLIVLGGAERVLLEEARYLERIGNHVVIITSYFDKNTIPKQYQKGKIETYSVFLKKFHESFYTPHDIILGILRSLSLLKVLIKIKPHVVIEQGCSIYLYLATRIYRVPYILHIHETMFWKWGLRDLKKYCFLYRDVFDRIRLTLPGHRQIIKPKCKLNFAQRVINVIVAILDFLEARGAKKIFVSTERLRWEVQNLYRRDAVVIRIGVGLNERLVAPLNIKAKYGIKGKRLILTVNRLDPIKRLDLLVKAFSIVHQDYKDTILMIVGTGPEESRLKEIVKEKGLSSDVIFTGFVDEKVLPFYYTSCDVFAFPSWDSYGLSALEAVVMGKKCIITVDAGVGEILKEEKNVFIAYPSVSSFSQKMIEALCRRETFNVSSTIKQLNWENYFRNIWEEIRKRVKE